MIREMTGYEDQGILILVHRKQKSTKESALIATVPLQRVVSSTSSIAEPDNDHEIHSNNLISDARGFVCLLKALCNCLEMRYTVLQCLYTTTKHVNSADVCMSSAPITWCNIVFILCTRNDTCIWLSCSDLAFFARSNEQKCPVLAIPRLRNIKTSSSTPKRTASNEQNATFSSQCSPHPWLSLEAGQGR